MLQIFLGVTNSNKFNFEIWSFINLHRNVLPFSPLKIDKKFGKILSIKPNLMLFMSRTWVDINCHLSTPSCHAVQIGNSYNWQTFRSKCGCIHTGYKQGSLQRRLKMTHKDFAILNSHVTVMYLTFIKSTNFFVVKQKNLKQLYFSLLFILVDVSF